MNKYLVRLKTLKSEMPASELLSKPTKPSFVSFGSEPTGHIGGERQATLPLNVTPQPKEDADPKYLWRNPFPKGTPEARAESLRVIEEAQRGVIPHVEYPVRVNTRASWPAADQSIIDWFLTVDPPTEPFYLEPQLHIAAPVKFFSALKMDIEAGPDGPRGKHGALIHDLTILKRILHEKGELRCATE